MPLALFRFAQSMRLGAAVAVAVSTLAVPAAADDLLVFAAASLRNALERVAVAWEAETGKGVEMSYAATSSLARQIEEGAPADIFFSADIDWMDYLSDKGLVDPQTRRTLLGNSLVLVASGSQAAPVEIESGFRLPELLGERRLAVADVEAVPAGRYAAAALRSLGVWEDVKDRLAQAENVRAALAFVALGEAPYGIVYATDARVEEGVTVVGTFPDDSHPPIRYPVALTAEADPAAAEFLRYLGSDEAREIFAAEGFAVLSSKDARAYSG